MNSKNLHATLVPPNVSNVTPKTNRPAKVSKSVRVRPWLLERVEAVCAEQELTFNDAVERALEAWVKENGA